MLPTKPEKHCLYTVTSLEWTTFSFENFHFHLPETSIINVFFSTLTIIGHFQDDLYLPCISLVQQVCEECYGRQHGEIIF